MTGVFLIYSMSKKLVIVGGVAGGATAAARARRLDESAEIILLERGEYISFANCGLPYYIGGVIQDRDNLLVTTIEDFKKRYRIDIRNFSEVIQIDREKKRVEVYEADTEKSYYETYDSLILSPGAEPVKPPLPGIELPCIFTLRNLADTDAIKEFIDNEKPGKGVVIGAGFIGLEMAENLVHLGIETTVVEMLEQVMPPLDVEMAGQVQSALMEKGVELKLGERVISFWKTDTGVAVSTYSGEVIECDFVILSIGVRPENRLAVESGLSINERGNIKVDSSMRSDDPDIFVIGDAIETQNLITGKPAMVPLAGPANKQGRIAADNVMNRESRYPGVLGTSILKLFDVVVASTGLNERSLKENGIPYLKSYTFSNSHAGYYPGAERLSIKLLFSPDDGRVLGSQIIGKDGVDKRIDVIATAIYGKMTVHDLENLELAYAPPYSSAKDPVNIAGFVAANMLKEDIRVIHWDELPGLDMSSFELVDLRSEDEIEENGAVPGSLHIPMDDLRDRLPALDRGKNYLLICAIGLRGYIGYRIMVQHGFKAYSFSGGYELFCYGSHQKS